MNLAYSAIRRQIKSGDVLFFRGSGPGPWLIRKWTSSEWSHTGIAWVVGGRVLLLEVHPFAGVRAIPLSKKRPDAIVSVGVYWGRACATSALAKLGNPYGWLDCVRAGCGLPVPEDDCYQCSEYVGSVMRSGGVAVPDSASGTPKSLYQWCLGRICEPAN